MGDGRNFRQTPAPTHRKLDRRASSYFGRSSRVSSAHVWLRPSPRQLSDTSIASLLDISPLSAGEEFWHLYSSLLTLIAEDKDEQGHPNFEAHSLTRFYEEIIQATKGSRWVLCMTLSSVAEGIIRLLNPTGQKVKIDNYMKKLVSQNVPCLSG